MLEIKHPKECPQLHPFKWLLWMLNFEHVSLEVSPVFFMPYLASVKEFQSKIELEEMK